MAYIDPFAEPADPVVAESARINRELKALFNREAEYFERQLAKRSLMLNDRGLAQTETNLREFIDKAIADIDRSLKG